MSSELDNAIWNQETSFCCGLEEMAHQLEKVIVSTQRNQYVRSCPLTVAKTQGEGCSKFEFYWYYNMVERTSVYWKEFFWVYCNIPTSGIRVISLWENFWVLSCLCVGMESVNLVGNTRRDSTSYQCLLLKKFNVITEHHWFRWLSMNMWVSNGGQLVQVLNFFHTNWCTMVFKQERFRDQT